MKIILDNREKIAPFYDGVSMGGGYIEFACDKCCGFIREETLKFIMRSDALNIQKKKELYIFFNVASEPIKKHEPEVGLILCPKCHEEYALYISYGEVQSGRYQASLVAIADMKL
ncbi:hypothetical protein [Marinomonas transparens]|uniref:Uncharacterized protein n=1 Tax=Marinomonas transparens TaxID=2795388 RepID=A0A934N3U7_9GAMM|nr:hypothetical protein [Marinomonas transparens]MBJ7540052.1 hypothetical protein [Marinomonas transparens]